MTPSRNAVSHEPLVIAMQLYKAREAYMSPHAKLQLAKCHAGRTEYDAARQSEGGCQQGLPFDAGGRAVDLNAVASFLNPQS